LQMQPYHGRVRAVLFRDADSMSEQAANTLLKTLEEPRRDTYLILTAANPARLPRTVLSRSQLWYFGPLAGAEVEEALAGGSAKPDEAGLRLAGYAEGSPGLALELAHHTEAVA